jgi:hypothetical protein
LKKVYSWKFNLYFLDQKLQFTYPCVSIKDAQATGEDFSPQKRTSSTSKHENSGLFLFCGSFLPSWIRIRNLNADPDPDQATQINADPCGSGSGSETLTRSMDLQVVSSSTASGMDGQGVPLSTTSKVTYRVYPSPSLAMWTCTVVQGVCFY